MVKLKMHGNTPVWSDDSNNTSYPLDEETVQGILDVLQGRKKSHVVYDRRTVKHERTLEDKVIDIKGMHKEDDPTAYECST